MRFTYGKTCEIMNLDGPLIDREYFNVKNESVYRYSY